MDSWFFVFRYFQPFYSHSTSNFSKYRYIYIITVILRPTFWRYGDGSSTKIMQPWTLLYIIHIYIYILVVPFSNHATSNFSIYRCIYIITVILRPTCWRYGGGSSIKKIENPARFLLYTPTDPGLFGKRAPSVSPTRWP